MVIYKCRDCGIECDREKLKFPKEEVEPSCPKCGHYNAMLWTRIDPLKFHNAKIGVIK